MSLENNELDISNLQLIEEFYEKYHKDPENLSDAWKCYFNQIDTQNKPSENVACTNENAPTDLNIFNLIKAYRTFGHLSAKVDPLASGDKQEPWQLKLENFGFNSKDLKKQFPTGGILNKEVASLEDILSALKKTYCHRVGIEYMGIVDPEVEAWIQNKIEPNLFNFKLTINQKKTILEYLNHSELFEVFLQTKYPGQKRFSLEGGETLIPILEAFVEKGADLDAIEFIIGMAHRGRLNVLSNILKKSYVNIFSEFDENYIPESFEGSGDVKYHKGFYSESLSMNDLKINIALTPNPSHLEAVDPVVEGQVKAKQIKLNDPKAKDLIIPILVHGDAAISGQGVVYETLQLSKLDGYATGGTLHVVINNQIGFTTLPKEGRSTTYCTDIGKTFGSPVFHVNAEDPECCFNVALMAVELRQKFNCDVFIDLNCYRKYGHNETDEPAFTQPHEYAIIRNKKSIREIYRDDLIQQGILEKKMAEELEVVFKQKLQESLTETKLKSNMDKNDKPLKIKTEFNPFNAYETGVALQTLEQLAEKISTTPENFTPHPKLQTLLKDRLSMVLAPTKKTVDWGMAETLAYASLLEEGKNIRLTGQDTARGTFSHRHGLWVDQKQEKNYIPLQHISEDQGRFDLINSPLSEYAALGFEFGYSVSVPRDLVIWEAQFGDFSNGAQVIIDQFISTSEQKWGTRCSLTLLLPHGYEGQGPEHSSARIERFLTLSGNNNMFVVNPTTPVQLFHLLRRQTQLTKFKPLIVFTPKGLLRHPECVSPIVDFTKGRFEEVLDDPTEPKNVTKLVYCSGRIYYDIASYRLKNKIDDMAIIRLEQIYPFHENKIKEMREKYKSAKEIFWVQEESKNMGAWDFVEPLFLSIIPKELSFRYVGRNRSASPAAGSYALHKKEHAAIMQELFN